MSGQMELLQDQVRTLTEQVETLAAEVRALRDIEEIKQLKARYCRFIDTQDWAAWRDEVLTEDFAHESLGETIAGRDAVVDSVAGAMEGGTSFHHVHAPEIAITGADTATGVWALRDVTKLPGDGTPIVFRGAGYYAEDYVRTDQGWRVQRNVVTFHDVEPTELAP
jgi:hypothetical protein